MFSLLTLISIFLLCFFISREFILCFRNVFSFQSLTFNSFLHLFSMSNGISCRVKAANSEKWIFRLCISTQIDSRPITHGHEAHRQNIHNGGGNAGITRLKCKLTLEVHTSLCISIFSGLKKGSLRTCARSNHTQVSDKPPTGLRQGGRAICVCMLLCRWWEACVPAVSSGTLHCGRPRHSQQRNQHPSGHGFAGPSGTSAAKRKKAWRHPGKTTGSLGA